MLKQIITNKEEHINLQNGSLSLADCAGDSLMVLFKLRKIGAVRVRGKRDLEREQDIIHKNKKSLHYWVESKDIVFEEHGGVQQIFKKDFYYQAKNITDVEVARADMCGFFPNELPASICGIPLSKWFENIGDKELLYLIAAYRAKKPSND